MKEEKSLTDSRRSSKGQSMKNWIVSLAKAIGISVLKAIGYSILTLLGVLGIFLFLMLIFRV